MSTLSPPTVMPTPPDDPRGAPRRSPGDTLGWLAVLCGAVVFLIRGWDGIVTRDLALYAYAGQRVADGVPPYVGVMNRSGPLAHLVPGVGAWLGRTLGLTDSGVQDVYAERALFFVLTLLFIFASYRLVVEVFDSRLAGLVGAIAMVMNPGVITYATGGPREKTTMVLLFTLMLLAGLRGRFALTGVLLALATLTWQPVFFPGFVTAMAFAMLLTDRRVRAVMAVLVGGALTTGLYACFAILTDSWDDAKNGFVMIHIFYTRQPGFWADAGEAWTDLREAFGLSTYVIIAGLVALLIAALLKSTPNRRPVIALALGTTAGLAWSYGAFNGWADAMVLFPFAIIGLGWCTVMITSKLRLLGRMIAILAVLGAVASGAHAATDHTFAGLSAQARETEAVFDILPNAKVWSIEAPQALVLGRKVNVSQHQMFRIGLEKFVADEYGGLSAYAAHVMEQQPEIIVVGLEAHYDWITPVLADYEQFGTSYGWYWYVSKNVDPSVRDELADAVG